MGDWQPMQTTWMLLVGFKEQDPEGNQDDSEFARASPGMWYSDDCRNYEVEIYRQFKASTQVSTCYTVENSVSGSIGGTLKGVDLGLNGETNSSWKRCEEFKRPAEFYVWIVEVRHANAQPINKRLTPVPVKTPRS